MIDGGILITAGVGFLTTIVSGWTSWFFARKKYNSEVDNNLINNMKESLEFYTRLSEDNKLRLDRALSRNEELEKEVKELRQQVMGLVTNICTDLSCQIRKGNYEDVIKLKK